MNKNKEDDHIFLPRTHLLMLSAEEELGNSVYVSLGATVDGCRGEVNLRGAAVCMETLTGVSREHSDLIRQIKNARSIVMLVRHIDVISVQSLRSIYRSLPSDITLPPFTVFLVRDEGGQDFKVSCQECGQKLWVRDADVGKKGRCPNCRVALELMDQESYLRQQLSLPAYVPVEKVMLGTGGSIRAGITRALSRAELVSDVDFPIAHDVAALKRATMRIVID
ncbi:MAG: hypothetical protein EOL87_13580 [Spartobacteria bacterium]|nr:hypothetical protein [Spartobacteria bacterium]